MARQGRRVAVVGATGNVGSELVRALEERDFPVASLLPIATDESLGEAVELRGEDHPVETGEVSLRGSDVVFVCTPAEAAGPWVRAALGAEAPCVDLSGALATREEVPLVVADLAPPRERLMEPLVAGPPGPSLVLALALEPLRREAGLTRVTATALESVGSAGREGVRALEAEVVALFSQSEPPESSVFATPVAFDLVPELAGAERAHGPGAREEALVAALRRLVGDVPATLTLVRVPAFTGLGVSVFVETERPAPAAQATEWLVKAPGLEVWDPDAPGPSTREASDRGTVLVGRVRGDASGRGLHLWLAADPVRLAAHNAVRVAEARFDLH